MKSKHFQKEKALVVGNGESRKRIDLNLFNRDKWEIYGCNALYRDFNPDHLVIIDDVMRKEFELEKVRSFYNMPKYIYFVEDIIEYEPMISAGCAALLIAMRHHSEIDLIGFVLPFSDVPWSPDVQDLFRCTARLPRIQRLDLPRATC